MLGFFVSPEKDWNQPIGLFFILIPYLFYIPVNKFLISAFLLALTSSIVVLANKVMVSYD